MPTIITDLIEGTKAISDGNGLTVTRTIYLDVSDIANLSADRKIVECLGVTGIPRYGDLHPSYSSLQVSSVTGDPWTQNQIKVTVNYETITISTVPDETKPALQNVGTSSQEVEVNIDRTGAPIVVTYTDPVTGETFNVGGKVKIYKPLTIVKFKRFELNSPLSKSTAYGASINSVPWMGYPARTWLCMRIDGDLVADGTNKKYLVNYEFQYKPNTYKVAALYTKPDGTFPQLTVQDLLNSNGITLVDAFFETDFNQLRLL
jgi:hypothetical protein